MLNIPCDIQGFDEIALEEDLRTADDGQMLFCGYKTLDGTEGYALNSVVALRASIVPQGAPYKYSPPQKPKRPLFMPSKLEARIRELTALISELEQQIPTPPDEAFEAAYLEYIDVQRLKELYAQARQAWEDKEAPFEERYSKAGALLSEIAPLFADLSLPEELMRSDTKFAECLDSLLELLSSVQIAQMQEAQTDDIELAEINPVFATLWEFQNTLEHLLCEIAEQSSRLRGIPYSISNRDYRIIHEKELRLERPNITIDEMLECLQELWEIELRPPEDRIESLNAALDLIYLKAAGIKTIELSPERKALNRHLAYIGKQIAALNEEGIALWAKRLTKQFLEPEDKDGFLPITEPDYSEMLVLELIDIKTQEHNDKISCTIDLYFYMYGDHFEGRVMAVTLQDGEPVDYRLADDPLDDE